MLAAAATLAVGALVLFLTSGSGEARVTGKVTLDDQPFAQATVIFVREDKEDQAPLVAITNEDGDYRVIGHKGAGIAPGKYKVTVSKLTLKDGTIPKGEAYDQARQAGRLHETAPPTSLVFDVRGGANTVNIPLRKSR